MNSPLNWGFRSAVASDAPWMVELRAVVMRPHLERLGVFDPQRVRQRFLDAYRPDDTRVITVDGRDCGLVALRGAEDGWWLEHFYLDPALQGRGVGHAVLEAMLVPRDERPYRLNVLQGSPARRLYERFGFVAYDEDDVDVFMIRHALVG